MESNPPPAVTGLCPAVAPLESPVFRPARSRGVICGALRPPGLVQYICLPEPCTLHSPAGGTVGPRRKCAAHSHGHRVDGGADGLQWAVVAAADEAFAVGDLCADASPDPPYGIALFIQPCAVGSTRFCSGGEQPGCSEGRVSTDGFFPVAIAG